MSTGIEIVFIFKKFALRRIVISCLLRSAYVAAEAMVWSSTLQLRFPFSLVSTTVPEYSSAPLLYLFMYCLQLNLMAAPPASMIFLLSCEVHVRYLSFRLTMTSVVSLARSPWTSWITILSIESSYPAWFTRARCCVSAQRILGTG